MPPASAMRMPVAVPPTTTALGVQQTTASTGWPRSAPWMMAAFLGVELAGPGAAALPGGVVSADEVHRVALADPVEGRDVAAAEPVVVLPGQVDAEAAVDVLFGDSVGEGGVGPVGSSGAERPAVGGEHGGHCGHGLEDSVGGLAGSDACVVHVRPPPGRAPGRRVRPSPAPPAPRTSPAACACGAGSGTGARVRAGIVGRGVGVPAGDRPASILRRTDPLRGSASFPHSVLRARFVAVPEGIVPPVPVSASVVPIGAAVLGGTDAEQRPRIAEAKPGLLGRGWLPLPGPLCV